MLSACRERVAEAGQPRKLALLFCFYATLAVLLVAPLVPPLENPDEINHVHRAEQVASGQWLARRYAGDRSSGGMVDLGVNLVDAPIGIIRFHPDRKVTPAMLNDASAVRWSTPTGITFANTAIYPPFFYLPAALGIRIGQALRQPIARTLVLARILTGLCCTAVATLAIAGSGRTAPLLFTVLCLPMSLSLFAAVSQDGLMLAASAMAMAATVRLRAGDGGRPVLLLPVCLGLVAMARPAYLPFLILPLLLPELSRRTRFLAVAGTLAAVLAWVVLVVRFTTINANGYRGVDPPAQLRFLLGHPGRWGAIVLGTLHRQGATGHDFFPEFVGVLGWSDVALPVIYYTAAALVLAIAVLVVAGGPPLLPPAGRGVMAMATCGAVLLVFLLEYLSWTRVGAGFVDGVQGRYFLPIALLLPCVLPRLDRVRTGWLLPVLMAFPMLSIAVMLYGISTRYYP